MFIACGLLRKYGQVPDEYKGVKIQTGLEK